MTSVSGVEDYLSMGGKEYGQYNLVYHDNSQQRLDYRIRHLRMEPKETHVVLVWLKRERK